MAANPNPQQQRETGHPRETPDFNPRIEPAGPAGPMGQRARPTIPMTHHDRDQEHNQQQQIAAYGYWEQSKRALSGLTQVQLRDPCGRCGGRSYVDRPFMQCDDPTCGREWTDEQVAKHLRHKWRKELPCGHPMPGHKIFLNTPCPACFHSPVGRGYLPAGERLGGWVTLDELLPLLVALMERHFAEVSARMRALDASGQPHHF